MLLTATIREEMSRLVLCWLATVSADGTPNVSPKEMFAACGDDAIAIADIASPVSVRNAKANPKVCVSFVDVFRQRGFKIIGAARIISPDEADFERCGAGLLTMTAGAFPIRHIILIRIEHVSSIRAPSYTFYPEKGEDALMAQAYRAYGVQPMP
jgi:predicted pyridoxine 5'-phosphate oxidase superfamily flavin-nucleotide-binding protein